ncbi:MAG: methionine--tRNA ligase [Candidatus Omnitrophica bacterium]|nr:methionine--tRNA ligase [Candidatus Omnitrophota bacterium]MCB9747574.1 methionine--tRNA ligase [Candidatus Omnitrophota bacterium]
MNTQKFYVTTPIYYVNDKPHIGHAYTTILADVLTRFHRGNGEEAFFLTGLDEHGQKVQQAAEKRGLSPLDHCNDLAPRFLQLWEKLEIQYDDFIRTTQSRHIKVVQTILQKVYDAGDIYMDEYEGWYSVSEERFITETEKDSGEFRDIKNLKERNWFFKMSKYQQQLIDYINDHPEFIQPQHRRNEILGFLRQPLGDLCISRPKSRLNWGIEIPFDKDYVTYVWFDALINYISAIGYSGDENKFQQWWPASVQLIGKDILTTHCVYWTTMLFSLKLPLPKTIFAHGWWLTGETKMSKSLGNIVNPLDLIDEYGVDPVRYYLMREMVLGQDASFTIESFIKRYNSDLANDFGNLLNRVSGLIGKYFDGCIPEVKELTPEDCEVKKVASALKEKVANLVNDFHVNEAIEEVLILVRQVNKYLELQAPWKTVKEDLERTGTILYVTAEALRVSAVHLFPVIPSRSGKVLAVLGAQGTNVSWGGLKPGTKLQAHEALFPRIEIEKT